MKAANSGDPYAMFYVGVCYENGMGVVYDKTKGFEWFLKAANHGDARAKQKLKNCYLNN